MNRKMRTQNSIILLMNLISFIIFALVFYFIWYAMYHDIVYFYQKGNWIILGVYAVILALFMQLYGGFRIGTSKIVDLIYSQSLSFFFANILMYFQSSLVVKSFVSINGFILIIVCSFLTSLITNYCIHKIYLCAFPAKKTIILYQNNLNQLDQRLNKYQSNNFKIIDVVQYNSNFDINDLLRYEAIILSGIANDYKSDICNLCYDRTISVYEVPNLYDIAVKNALPFFVIDTPILKLNNFGPGQFSKMIKRGFDVLVASLGLIISSPIWIIAAVGIKLTDNGPIFYKQKRLTQYGKEFDIIKFRSMRIDAEKDGIQFAKENDNRITPIGKILRKLRIDELPQLFNIVRGEMSIVGPRPERPEIANEIYKELPQFENRLKVKAGLTGYAQVYGKYNTSLSDKLLFDLMYIENYSLLLDVKIIFMTIKVIFMKESTEGVSE